MAGFMSGVASLIFPSAGGGRRSGLRWLVWLIHLVLLAGILVGLHFLNQALGISVRIPDQPPLLRENWLPILFLLVYILAWLGWWLWHLLVTEEEVQDFPDIRAAWEEALEALHRAGIDLREVPLYLVLGHSEGKEEALFQAALLDLTVKQAPHRSDAPLHVYANQEGIYVTCTGISLLGQHTLILTGEDSSGVLPMTASTDDDILDVTNRPGRAPDTIPEVEALLARVREERRLPTREERRKMRVLLRKDRAQPSLLRNASEVERCEARFRYFCRLLVRDRAPFVPLNGILVLLPFAAADTDQDALDTGTACQRDLTLARQVLQVNCPVFALICDLESAPGFAEFLELFPAKQRHQRVGQRCPLIPDLTLAAGRAGNVSEARAALLDSLATWICSSVVPGWVYKNFRLEEPGEPNIRKLVHNNARLFLLLHELRERRHRLGRVLERSLDVDGEPIWFGGCYLGATGIDPDHEQGFVAGAFRRLAEEEKRGLVSWTPEALQEEAQYQHWALLGQITLAFLILATAGLIGYIFFGPGSKT